MDTSDPDITFDNEGISNHYYNYKKVEKAHVLTGEAGRHRLEQTCERIKQEGHNKRYDCIIGLSGGVDSTYLCLLAKEQGLRPLVVHFDNGWNSELAVKNIEQTVTCLGFDLYTHVVDWDEFRELQRSYFAANVVDIEVLTDHGFMAALYQQAAKHKIKYVLGGMNVVTESILAPSWIYNKSDLTNIKGIQERFGSRPLKAFKTFPFCSNLKRSYLNRILSLEVISPLNWLDYKYDEVKARLGRELAWRDYGGKHFESVFTRFYQGYILPRKFKFDKRRGHLSTLICSGQMKRDEAIQILKKPALDESQVKSDYDYVTKKLGFSREEFEAYLDADPVAHEAYGVELGFRSRYPVLKWAFYLCNKVLPLRGKVL